MKVFCAILFIIVASAETPQAQQTDSFDKLAADFWSWRARYAPFTGDDVNRIERPGGVRDWSRAKLDNQRKELTNLKHGGGRSIPALGRSPGKSIIAWLAQRCHGCGGSWTLIRAGDAIRLFISGKR